jgi:alpha-galactosidase
MEHIFGGIMGNVEVTSAGLNHFYWILKAVTKKAVKLRPFLDFPAQELPEGTDLVPLIRERGPPWLEKEEAPLIAELLRIYGYLTYPGQSHPGEYVPWADAYAIAAKYDYVKEQAMSDGIKQDLQDVIDGKKANTFWLARNPERAVAIITACEMNDPEAPMRELAVNIRNDGFIDRLPEDCVVEVPAAISTAGIVGEKIGRMPQGIEGLLLREITVQDLVVEAAVTGDYNVALQALCADPTVQNPNVGRAILDRMLDIQKDYLPQFSRA